jgi:hypothetical protein
MRRLCHRSAGLVVAALGPAATALLRDGLQACRRDGLGLLRRARIRVRIVLGLVVAALGPATPALLGHVRSRRRGCNIRRRMGGLGLIGTALGAAAAALLRVCVRSAGCVRIHIEIGLCGHRRSGHLNHLLGATALLLFRSRRDRRKRCIHGRLRNRRIQRSSDDLKLVGIGPDAGNNGNNVGNVGHFGRKGAGNAKEGRWTAL